MDIKFRVIEKVTQSTTFCNLKDDFKQLLPLISQKSEIINLQPYGKIRCGQVITNDSLIYFVSNSKDYINSSSKFKNDLSYLTSLIESFLKDICQQQVEFQKQRTQRLSHNIRSINANCLTSFFSFFPQEELSKKDNKLQNKIDKISRENHLDIPNLLLKLHKNHLAIKTEFEVFEKLYTQNPFLSKKRHKVHRVLMNVFYRFFNDFQEKRVIVNIYPSESKSTFDYDTIHVAFFHLFENAYKYSKPNSTIDVSITENGPLTIITYSME
ncbi:ATP-binding protein [Acinetobacter pittii]|uniref:ATP-binding protein n=1 Tax=Acinetobacter pittii TaxID=48296 RepID=UPI0028131C5D|nr:ATP-binding protein [Acinetobacter pittii]MDQ9813117.1 ATP-binding protein [Acinetobacter pittii]